MDDLGLEQPVNGFGERIVVAVADAADRGSMPASARRSVYLIERYWLPRSL
jgi:hypothetical protein